MSLFALGISHQTAPISIRERLAFAAEVLPEATRALASVPGVAGCAIISTCNRTELYLSGRQTITREVSEWLHDWHGLQPGQFREHLYQLEQSACIFHLIKVISGADSMIIGEPQVAGQVKQAWQAAHDLETLDSKLDRMFQHAFAGAKRVRSQTGIGRDPVTLPFASLRLARQIFGSLDDLSALLIGAGEMIEDCATHFRESGLKSLTIANRSIERAQDLAARHGAVGHGLDDLPTLLPEHDLVIACTASPTAILSRDMLRKAIGQRRHRPIFALDLSVPRNIEASSADLSDVFLYTIDDLHAIIESNQQKRKTAMQKAVDIIEAEALAFERWLRLQDTSATLKGLRKRAQAERDLLLAQARTQLAAGQDPEDVLQRLSHRLVNRLLHGPSIRLRQAAESADENLLEAARYYFLDDPS
jgi:glutamyl-tRNA reductase